MLKKIERLAPHGAILICNMYIVFFLIDRVNPAMNFIDNGLTKGLLLILCAISLYDAWRLLKPVPARRPAPAARPAVDSRRQRPDDYASRTGSYRTPSGRDYRDERRRTSTSRTTSPRPSYSQTPRRPASGYDRRASYDSRDDYGARNRYSARSGYDPRDEYGDSRRSSYDREGERR